MVKMPITSKLPKGASALRERHTKSDNKNAILKRSPRKGVARSKCHHQRGKKSKRDVTILEVIIFGIHIVNAANFSAFIRHVLSSFQEFTVFFWYKDGQYRCFVLLDSQEELEITEENQNVQICTYLPEVPFTDFVVRTSRTAGSFLVLCKILDCLQMFNKLQWYVNDDLCSYKVDLSKKQLTELPFEYDTPDNICHYGDYILGENKSSDTTTVKNKILDLVVPLKGIEIYAFPCLKSYFNQLALPTNSYKNIIYNDGELLPNPPQWRPGIKHGGVENAHEQNNISTLESARTNDISRSKRRRPRYPGKCTMESRLDTFTTWSHSAPTPQTLAADGFFFTGDADFVRCHQCGIELKDFSPFGDPLSEHIKHAGSCDFLTDLYGITGLEQKRCLINDPETLRKRQLESFHTQTAPDRTNRRPEFACYEARLDTFDGWSEDVSQKPHQLADAGLYFTGVEDHVRCFACDGGLWQWDAGDDPWVEHCRWFPACHFARTSKGDQYIERIQASIDQGEDLSELEETRPSGKDDTTLGLTKLEQHRRTLTAEEIKEDAIQHRKYGNISPTLNDLNIRKRNEIRPIQQEAAAAVDRHESIFEENSRLKHILKCQWCNVNNVNALFLPCAHHRMCMECASKHDITVCFVCDRHIREIIKTFMG
ncbi:baculoviral IAP repeat-containing protein 7-A-like isoform X1 [Mya arenaria]|uniref:baculoviral IAP repeat-containing protein 7-A-like isoform X1 n=1 Tax=Mya arenaria TaxID=6604 RepID=UPI0022E55801|nr:baculoviral IAP repeat-containing protein 7-A-like isoform X1 [Mya arenaria]